MIKLLIVDDEEEIRKGIRNAIDWKSNEIEVCGEAENGKQALQLINELKPDIILIDVRMPLLSGLQVIEAVHANRIPLKSILLSGYDDFPYVQQALKFGASGYLLKPCMPDEILENVLKLKEEIQNENVIAELLESLKSKFNENLPLLKEKYLLKLINNEIEYNTKINENFEFFRINIKPHNVTVIIIQIDNQLALFDKYNHNDIELLRFSLKNIISGIIQTTYGCEVFDNNNDFIILATIDDNHNNLTLIQLLKEVQENVVKSLGLSISIGIGENYEDITHVHRSYMEAIKSIEARFLVGTNSIITYDDVHYEEAEETYYPLEEEKQILICIKNGNTEALDNLIDQFFITISKDVHSKDHMIKSCLMLFHSLFHICLEKNIKTDNIPGIDLTSIDYLLNCRTLDQLKERISQIAYLIIDRISTRKSNTIIDLSLQYINENYADELNLEKVANSVFINPGYFCLLFKKTLGINFIDYVHKLRIEKACEQLEDVQYKTFEVALNVGYSNEKYFYQIFKKHTGMTPSQYRKSIREQL